jgi:hypothetical protein
MRGTGHHVTEFSSMVPVAGQTRMMSFVEAITNVVVGFVLALLTQSAIFPLLGLKVSIGDNVLIGGVFTAVSIVRTFALRRLFEATRGRKWRGRSFVRH